MAITVQVVCTLVCRWDPDDPYPVQMLALRDERSNRDFDPPGRWWPETPGAVGGRDRLAGGSWCISDVATGATAVVLNRPERRTAAPDAASRGVLPLLAVTWGSDWPQHVGVDEMASFNLVRADRGSLRWWSFDGKRLDDFALEPGTHLVKPVGRVADGVDPQLLSGSAQLDDLEAPTATVWRDWFIALRATRPTADGTGLLTRRVLDDGATYETVFGQFLAARAGLLRIDYLLRPATHGTWTTRILT